MKMLVGAANGHLGGMIWSVSRDISSFLPALFDDLYQFIVVRMSFSVLQIEEYET